MGVNSGSPITAESLNNFVESHQDDWKLLFDFTSSNTWTSGTKIYTNKSNEDQPKWEDFATYNGKPVVIEWKRGERGQTDESWYSFEKINISSGSVYFHTGHISRVTGTSSAQLWTGVLGLTRGSYNDEGTTVYIVTRESLTCQSITLSSSISISNANINNASMYPQRVWALEAPLTGWDNAVI